MNEQRLKAYLNLINALLNCPSGEEGQILNANSDLIDAGLVEAIAEVAEELEKRGDRNSANFLIDLARQLAEALGLSSATPTSSPLPNSSQLDFLLQVLQAVYESDGDSQVVYPLLQANLDKLDDNFILLLRNWTAATLSNADEPADAKDIAGVIGIFSDLIQQFRLGNIASNLEIAIAGYKIAAIIFTRKISPAIWASLQNSLGVAYTKRLLGKRVENLEQAINYYQQAFLEYTRDTFPKDWAMTQHNLGTVYNERILGKRAENLEQAINCYKQALLEYTRDAFPEKWALTHNNLGTAYKNRILGDRSENLEQAIDCCNQALLEYTHDAFPEDWADTHNNLGNIYNDRILGSKAENLEQAINCYKQALLEYTRDAFPEKWAETQNNLGTAYANHILGNKAENLEQAINCYNQALLEYTRDAFPERWAMTQFNLGAAYTNRNLVEKAENLEKAIDCYEQALLVRTREAFPEDWAMTQHNLGSAYSILSGIRCDGAGANLRVSSIRCYTEALQIRTCEAFPEGYAQTKFNLGLTYQKDNQLQLAHNTFADAINTVESLRGEIVSGDEAKQKLAEEWNKLYQHMVEVCLTLDNHTEAIEYADRSKTRNLVELILNRDLKTLFSPDVVTQLEQLRDEIASGQYQVQTATADNPTALAQHLQQLRQQRNELQDRYLRIGYGFKFDQFQATLDDHTAIIQWYIIGNKLEGSRFCQ